MNPKTRMVIELVLATIGAVLTVVTLIWPTWIETLFNASPDGGDGLGRAGVRAGLAGHDRAVRRPGAP